MILDALNTKYEMPLSWCKVIGHIWDCHNVIKFINKEVSSKAMSSNHDYDRRCDLQW